MDIVAINRLMLLFSKITLSENDKAEIILMLSKVQDWNIFYRHAVKLGLGGLISRHIETMALQSYMPDIITSKLYQSYLKTLSRNMVLYDFHDKINQIFRDNNIPFIPLKGIFLAKFVYEDIGIRQMSDIDLLVRKEDADRCVQILTELGFTSKAKNKNAFIKTSGLAKHLPTMEYNDILVEIHYRVLIDNTTFEVNMSEYWEHSKILVVNHDSTRVLSNEHLIQYLCVHLEKHFNEGKIQLYQFVDIAKILEKYQDEIDWFFFHKSCENNHCSKNVYRILNILQYYFSVNLPQYINCFIQHYKDEKAMSLFLLLVGCNNDEVNFQIKNQNLRNLKKIKGIPNKFRYVIGDIFPSKSFMYHRYRITFKPHVYIFYLLRLYKAVTILISHGIKNLFYKR